MQLSVGTVVEGKVSKITNFGAFINIDGGGSGMVHISEVANTYVKDINEHLKVGDSVKAKVVAINENHKIALSIKALLPPEPKPQQNRSRDGQRESRDSRGPRGNNTYVYQPPKPYTPATGDAPLLILSIFVKMREKGISFSPSHSINSKSIFCGSWRQSIRTNRFVSCSRSKI